MLARECGLALDAARAVLGRLPLVVPRQFSDDDATRIVERLRAAGVGAEGEAADGLPPPPCATHPTFESYASCTQCKVALCTVCEAISGVASLCPACGAKRSRKSRFQRVRVFILLGILALVVVFAAHDVYGRKARKDWDHTLSVAVVLLEDGTLDDAAIARFKERTPALEARLAAEQARWRTGAPKPFELSVFGPVKMHASPPPAPSEDGVVALAGHSWDMWRYLGPIDDEAGVASRAYDSRIYVVLHEPRGTGATFAEGESEQDGRVGTVGVELADGNVDFALIVVAHELFHTLGATDKYDAQGHARRPAGLAEPELGESQRFVELMARTRPTGSGEEKIPDFVDDIAVGPVTAQEIGWTR